MIIRLPENDITIRSTLMINVKALSERIEMNQSLLAQYIRGLKKPSKSQTRRILQGVQQIGRELSEVKFLI